jgi:co-chaperonin GroES (HSP10)
MKIVPLLHRILVKQDKLEEKDKDYRRASASGLIIPQFDEKVREQAAIDTGTVVAVGDTAFRDFHAVGALSVGDYVVFAKHAGKIIVDPDTEEKFVALNDEDVICKFTKEPVDG